MGCFEDYMEFREEMDRLKKERCSRGAPGGARGPADTDRKGLPGSPSL